MKSQKKSGPGASKGGKGGKGLHKPKAAISRKDRRKKERMEKKQRKQQFLMKKFGKVKAVVEAEDSSKKADGAKPAKEQKPKATPAPAAPSASRASKQQAASRRKQLVRDNKVEDKNIKKLEKMLKLNKRKKKTGLPKSFSEDGLDFILDACDSEKLEQLRDEFRENEFEKDSSGDSDQPQSDGEDEGLSDQSGEEDISDNELTGEVAMDSAGDDDEEEESSGQDNADENEMDDDSESEGSEGEGGDIGDVDDEDVKSEGGGEWEDIYGRKRDASGNVVQADTQSKYIPPALRAKAADEEGKRREALLKLQRKAKGLLNRLSSSNIGSITKEVEDLYQRHSRSDMNESLVRLLTDSLVSPVLTPERLVMEHAMLIGILHVNIGMEVGASIVQAFVQHFHNLHSSRNSLAEEGKELDNHLQIISHLYTFKVLDAELILDILTSLAASFTPKDIELILLVLKATGFSLRKDDPARLKSVILKIQEQSSRSSKEFENDSRTKFMLEVLIAIKNNNVKKIPNYDQEHLQMLQKNLRQFYRPDHSSFPLKIGLEDLVNADARGKWWLVGSAWAGNAKGSAALSREKDRSAARDSAGAVETSYSSDLMELARKMRMNTDTRKNIFCAIMSAEDYLEAFEILAKLNVPVHKEREVAFVLVDSCMNEKSFNPFYAHLLSKLCQFDRKYMIAAKFAIWDKIKDMHSLKKFRLENLAKFVGLMISLDSLGLSSLKVVEFADMDATCVLFLKTVLTELLGLEASQRRKIFKSISSHAKLRILREGLGLFLRHFMLKDLDPKEKERLGKIIEDADGAMMAGEGKMLL